MDGEEIAKLYNRMQEASDALRAQAEEILGLSQRLEQLTKDTPARYAGTRAKVEARRAREEYGPSFSCQ